MRLIIACLALSLFPTTFAAQTRRPTRQSLPASTPPAARKPRNLTETIRAADGREIRLYDDMTYDVVAAPPAAATVEIRVKAGVITRGGDVKSVARREFIIFSVDIKPAIATVIDKDGKALDVFGFYMADKFRALDNSRAYLAALEKVKSHIVGTFTTDFEGNAVIKVPRSNSPHYAYGSFDVGRSSCMWYLQFIPDKDGQLVLDNENAAYCG